MRSGRGLRGTPSFVVLALLSCGGRSGLYDFEPSGSGGAVTALDGAGRGGALMTARGGASTAAGGQSPAGASSAGGGGSNAAGANAGAGGNSLGGAGANGGSAAIGPWAILNHEDPPMPRENPFDWPGSPTTFTDVWSDSPDSALIATETSGHKAPPSCSVISFGAGAMLSFDAGPGHLYEAPRIAGLSMSDLWLAEDYFGLRHSDGAAWTIYEQPTAQLVWENAPNDVWACSSVTSTDVTTYQLVHWDGSVWSQFALPAVAGFIPHGLWSRSPTDTYLAGSAGTLLHWNGTTFELRTCGGLDSWSAVWGDATSIWTVGDGGAVARWQGESCTRLSTEALLGGVRTFSDIWGSGSDNVWIVGEAGSILRWNGATLAVEPSGVSDGLNAVWGTAAGVVWVVGENQTVLRRTF
jgi:hypothetical protein